MPVAKDKVRFITHLYPETLEQIDAMYLKSGCNSRSQFIENAVRFYIGYLSANDEISYLPNAMLSNMKSIVAEAENKFSNALYKVAVELGMVQNAFAWSNNEISKVNMDALRREVEKEVKRINGTITLEDAVEWQKE